jgi:hypothetical protein
VTGKPLLLDLTTAIRKVKVSVALNVSVLTTLLFVMQRGFTWWQGLCFAYCVCLSVVTTGTWGTLGRALELVAERVITELQLVRKPAALKPHRSVSYTCCFSLSVSEAVVFLSLPSVVF